MRRRSGSARASPDPAGARARTAMAAQARNLAGNRSEAAGRVCPVSLFCFRWLRKLRGYCEQAAPPRSLHARRVVARAGMFGGGCRGRGAIGRGRSLGCRGASGRHAGVRRKRVRGEVDHDQIVARLQDRTAGGLVETDPQLVRVDADAQIAVVAIVVFFERQPGDAHRRIDFQIAGVRAVFGHPGGAATGGSQQWIDIVSAAAAHDEGPSSVFPPSVTWRV